MSKVGAGGTAAPRPAPRDRLPLPDLARLLPSEYAAFRPLLRAGAARFFALLPAARQQEIVFAQLALPGGPRAAVRIVALLRQCPTLHKLGQLLARDQRLDAALRRQLQRLESLPPTTDIEALQPTLDAALGPRLPFRLGRHALAEGSVAIVVPFRHGRERAEGVLKLPRPGIGTRIEEEIATWETLCPWLAETGAALGLPPLPYAETFAALAGQLRAELAPEREQHHLAEAAGIHAHGALRVPALLPWCTPQLTAMTRLRGRPLAMAGGDPLPAARALASGLLARPFWHGTETALFHADPHAGNLLALDDGGIGVIDWSMAARLDARQCESLLRLVAGGLMFDAGLLRRGLGELFACPGVPLAPIDAAFAELADPRHGALPGIAWALRLLDRCAIAMHIALPAELLLLRKSLANLGGVLDDLAPGFNADRLLLAEGMARLIGELPLRLLLPFGTARWPSRLPSRELWSLALALPDLGRRAWCHRQQATTRRAA